MESDNHQTHAPPSRRLVCLKCNHVTSLDLAPKKICPGCGFSLVPPPAYSGWEPLDIIMYKLSTTLLDVQKLTSIWTWIATEDTRPEDVESVLPAEKSETQNEIRNRSVHLQKRKPSILWWVLTTITFTVVLYIVLTGVT